MVCTIPGKATHACLRDEVIRPGAPTKSASPPSISHSDLPGFKAIGGRMGPKQGASPLYKAGPFHHPSRRYYRGPTGAFSISAASRLEYSIWAPLRNGKEIKGEIETHIAGSAPPIPGSGKSALIQWPAWPSYICRWTLPSAGGGGAAYRWPLRRAALLWFCRFQ